MKKDKNPVIIEKITREDHEINYSMTGVGHCGHGQDALYGVYKTVCLAKADFYKRFKGLNYTLEIIEQKEQSNNNKG